MSWAQTTRFVFGGYGDKPRRFHHLDELVHHLMLLGTLPFAEANTISELDHGLQTAALLFEYDGDDPELHAAGLLHDLAHVWDVPTMPRHASLAADAVRPLLGTRVADLIRGHADTAAFTGHPDLETIMALRAADQGARVPDKEVPQLGHWLPTLRELASRQDGSHTLRSNSH